MPEFTYTARDNTGQKVTGAISAASQREALAALDKRSLFPMEVVADRPVVRSGRRVKAQLMATTYGQLAGLLRSGVPLLRSLSVLREQTSHAGLSEVLTQVHAQVEDGSTLAEAMAVHPKAFGQMAISMVRAGGEGGFMEDALVRVAEFTEQQEDLKGRVAGAVAYPIFLGSVGALVVTVLLVFFVPKFETLFESLRQRGQLPVVTEALLWTSDALGRYGLLIVAALVGAGLYIRTWGQTEPGKMALDRWKIKLPMVGPIFLSLAVARFCRVLGTLLHNGVPILRALEISSSAAGNRVLGLAITAAAENISAGAALSGPLAASGHFPRTVVEMIAVAEESNSLETVLTDIANTLERQTWRRLDLMVRLLEPIMLLIMASVVLVVAVALLLPVLKMHVAM